MSPKKIFTNVEFKTGEKAFSFDIFLNGKQIVTNWINFETDKPCLGFLFKKKVLFVYGRDSESKCNEHGYMLFYPNGERVLGKNITVKKIEENKYNACLVLECTTATNGKPMTTYVTRDHVFENLEKIEQHGFKLAKQKTVKTY